MTLGADRASLAICVISVHILDMNAQGKLLLLAQLCLSLRRVMRFVRFFNWGGGYAEFVAVEEFRVLPIPSGVSLVDAAALPLASQLTVYALSMLTNATAGKRVLMHGAASGIGTIALQYAKHVGCQVFAVSEELHLCKKLGAEVCINYKEQDFCKRAKAETGEKGVDIILDLSGRDHFQKNLDCLATGGSLVIFGQKLGSRVNVDLSVIVEKDINVVGGDLHNRGLLAYEETKLHLLDVVAKIWPLIEAGHIQPIIGKIFSFSEAGEAHRALEKCSIPGKLLLVPG
ncbi:uncharacterized protein [Primulina eburnea]|uniref:uncharacterized protein isoform X2 n=1 Tax=Primulina eburnea TaxID=1245227 RepID=UPI003C6C3C3C